MKTKNNNEGFTLLEVIIALAVLTIGLLGTAAMQITAIKGNAKASHLTEATARGLTQMESIISWDYNDARLNDVEAVNYQRIGDQLIGGGPAIRITTIGDVADSSIVDDQYTIFWDATPDVPAVDSTTIRVDVVWTEETFLKTVSLNFIKTRF